jgi:hypothetical protein
MTFLKILSNIAYWSVGAVLIIFILLNAGCGKSPRYARGDMVEWKLNGQRGMVIDIECYPMACMYYVRTNPEFQAVRASEIELEPARR